MPFCDRLEPPFPKLLLDTTVYIDQLRDTLPREIDDLINETGSWHSSVTEAELMALAGVLDPLHADTANVLRQVVATVERREPHRIVTPDRGVWREAGILAGLLARVQRYGKTEQRKVLNDALILLSATKHGCSVLTRNVADFDLMMQIVPDCKAVFYELGR